MSRKRKIDLPIDERVNGLSAFDVMDVEELMYRHFRVLYFISA
jgi:hypothetical protein